MRTLETDTILFTGYQYVASSCWLHIEPVGHDDGAHDGRLRGTTRNGFLFATNQSDVTDGAFAGRSARVSLSPALSSDPRALMNALASFWQHGTADGQRGARRHTELHPLHHSVSGSQPIRPPNTRVPHLLEGVTYRVRMDWAFPYCLEGEGLDTSLHPFELQSCRVAGRTLNRTGAQHWSRAHLVRFGRSRSWAIDRTYETQVLREDGTVIRTLTPPAPRADDPSWMRKSEHVEGEAREVQRPRLLLPHHDGFLLLHKLWLHMIAAYEHVCSFELARANLVRDRYRLQSLRRMFEYASGSTEDESARRYASEAFKLIDTFGGEVDGSERALEAVLARDAGPTFDYLVDAFGSLEDSGLVATLNRDWYSFDHFLGPLTFLHLAIWLIRQSPRADAFYERYGREMLLPPAGNWEGASESDDPMLIDQRLVDDPSPTALGRSAISFLKRSLKVYAQANQLFYLHHTRALWDTSIARAPLSALPHPSVDELKNFAKYLAGEDDSPEFERMLNALFDRRASRDDALDDATQRSLARRVEHVQFGRRWQLTSLASALDALAATIAITDIIAAYQSDPASLGRRQVYDVATNTLGLTTSMAALAGYDSAAFIRCLGRGASIIGIGFSGYQAYQAFAREDYYTGAMRSLQVLGSSAVFASGFMAATPATAPVALAMSAGGTIVVLGAEIALWVDEQLRTDYQRHASALFESLQDEPVQFEWDEVARRPAVVTRGMRRVVIEHREKKRRWPRAKVSGRAMADVVNADPPWVAFPEARWRFLDRQEIDRRADYERYCRQLGASASGAAPPLPYSTPSASTQPVAWTEDWL